MKRPLLFLLLLTPACSAANSGAGDTPSTASASADTSVTWQAAIRCDGAVLDVNADERRDVQFVIRDQDAVHALTNGVDVSNVPPGTINAKGEFILRGHVQNGIFYARDFSAATVTNGNIVGWVSVAGENAGLPGAGGGGDPSDLVIQFGEYTNWRFRSCQEEL